MDQTIPKRTAGMISQGTDNPTKAVRDLDRVEFVRDAVHRCVTGSELRTIPEAFVSTIIRGGDAFQLAQIVVSCGLNRALRLACWRRRLRPCSGAEVEIVLHGGTEAVRISDSGRVRKRVVVIRVVG